MGRSHALSGACAFVLADPVYPLPLRERLLGAAVCAGAAVMPDIDCANSTVSRSFGPLTRAFSELVAFVSGGHRNATHAGLGSGVFSGLAFAALALHLADWRAAATGAAVALGLTVLGYAVAVTDTSRGRGAPAYRHRRHGAWALLLCVSALAGLTVAALLYGRLLGTVLLGAGLVLLLSAVIRIVDVFGHWDDLAVFPGVAALLIFDVVDLRVVPAALTLGVLVHIAGDMITRGGCPLGWPWSQTMRGPQLIVTGGWSERWVITPGLWCVGLVAVAAQTGLLARVLAAA